MGIIKTLFQYTFKAVSLLVKAVVFPITYIYKRLKKRAKKTRRGNNDFPGVYIVSNNDQTVKIGRSKHVYRRLRSYRGY